MENSAQSDSKSVDCPQEESSNTLCTSKISDKPIAKFGPKVRLALSSPGDKCDSDSDYDVEVKFENNSPRDDSGSHSDTPETQSQVGVMSNSQGNSIKQMTEMSANSDSTAETRVYHTISLSDLSDDTSCPGNVVLPEFDSMAQDTGAEAYSYDQDADDLIYMRKQDGDKPYKCSECPSAFKKAHNLKVHLRIHTGESPYQCQECPAAFKSAGNLKTHMRVHTGEKPYQCSNCPSTFARACDLKKHTITHTGEKPYECMECHATFTVQSNLRRHMKIHAGNWNLYQCSCCTAAFSHACSLEKHSRNHAGDKSPERENV